VLANQGSDDLRQGRVRIMRLSILAAAAFAAILSGIACAPHAAADSPHWAGKGRHGGYSQHYRRHPGHWVHPQFGPSYRAPPPRYRAPPAFHHAPPRAFAPAYRGWSHGSRGGDGFGHGRRW
jgi:hypothetical protein